MALLWLLVHVSTMLSTCPELVSRHGGNTGVPLCYLLLDLLPEILLLCPGCTIAPYRQPTNCWGTMALAIGLSMNLYTILTINNDPLYVCSGTGCLGVTRTRYATGAPCPATQGGYVYCT